jgi:hypothetical protein
MGRVCQEEINLLSFSEANKFSQFIAFHPTNIHLLGMILETIIKYRLEYFQATPPNYWPESNYLNP